MCAYCQHVICYDDRLSRANGYAVNLQQGFFNKTFKDDKNLWIL
jgi:hypothetical protein